MLKKDILRLDTATIENTTAIASKDNQFTHQSLLLFGGAAHTTTTHQKKTTMKLRTAISKSKNISILIQVNLNDTTELAISKRQAREAFADYLDLEDEDGRFEDNNIIAEYEADGTLLLN